MNLTYSLICSHFKDTAEEISVFNLFDENYRKIANPSDLETKMHVQLMASSVEKAYTFMEKILAEILHEIDQVQLSGDAWHKKLLLAVREKTDVRPEIISEPTFVLLDDLRSFRHIERNRYQKTLDATIVLSKVVSMNTAFMALQDDFKLFSKCFFELDYVPFRVLPTELSPPSASKSKP